MPTQKTFALVFPGLTCSRYLGVFIEYLENKNFSIKGLKLMSVNEKFAKTHLVNPSRSKMKIPKDNRSSEAGIDYWVTYLSRSAVVVMILEGEDSIRKVSAAADQFPKYLEEWGQIYYYGRQVYYSDSGESVEQDIKLWFNDEHDKWSEDYLGTGLGFVFPDKELGQRFEYNLPKTPFS